MDTMQADIRQRQAVARQDFRSFHRPMRRLEGQTGARSVACKELHVLSQGDRGQISDSRLSSRASRSGCSAGCRKGEFDSWSRPAVGTSGNRPVLPAAFCNGPPLVARRFIYVACLGLHPYLSRARGKLLKERREVHALQTRGTQTQSFTLDELASRHVHIFLPLVRQV